MGPRIPAGDQSPNAPPPGIRELLPSSFSTWEKRTPQCGHRLGVVVLVQWTALLHPVHVPSFVTGPKEVPSAGRSGIIGGGSSGGSDGGTNGGITIGGGR